MADVTTTCSYTTTTLGQTTPTSLVCSSSTAVSHDDVHEFEQEFLVGGSLVVFASFAVLVGSWRRSSS